MLKFLKATPAKPIIEDKNIDKHYTRLGNKNDR